MKILYLDLGMGAAGDMLTAALLELFPDREAVLAELNALGIPGVEFSAAPSVKCGITGTHVSVKVDGVEEGEPPHDHDHHHDHDHEHEHAHHHDHHHNHDHEHAHEHHHDHDHEHGREHEHEHGHHHDGHGHHRHTSLRDVEEILGGLRVSDRVKADTRAVYDHIAAAESRAHGVPVTDIHFHEVGTMDAIADVTAVCCLLEKLAPDRIVASPVRTGTGQVRCAHGILPVPAPATADILRGVPTYGGDIRGELCTPTGAALVRRFADSFGAQPPMAVTAVGYGMGTRDFEAANCVRAMLGDDGSGAGDTMYELSCNVDDMTAERIAFAAERLFEAGAREVYTVPIGMKKSRPGTLLRVICAPEDRPPLVRAIFRHTTTIGVREVETRRYILDRTEESLDTPYGPVRRKRCSGYGAERVKYEYDDLARIARERGISLDEAAALLDGLPEAH